VRLLTYMLGISFLSEQTGVPPHQFMKQFLMLLLQE